MQNWFDLKVPVFLFFYALPIFTTVPEVIHNRRRLLLHALWLPLSTIPVPGGGVGHHEVHYNSSTGRHWVKSDDEIEFEPEFQGVDDLTRILERGVDTNNLMEAMRAFNKIFIGQQDEEVATSNELDDSSMSGIALMANIHE